MKHTMYLKINHPPIISKERFQAVQMKKSRRSNIIKGEDDSQRKSSKYSSKKGDR